MIYLGDFPTSAVVSLPFDTFAGTSGASITMTGFVAGDVLIYKNGGTTQRSSSAGITVSTDFDSQTGLHLLSIDTSDNTDAGFYSAGAEYLVAVADVTVDTQTVRFWVGGFSIERAGGILALLKHATYGLSQLARPNTIIETQGNYTLQQAMSVMLAALAGVTDTAGVVLRTPNGATVRISATVNTSNERTAMTLTPSA